MKKIVFLVVCMAAVIALASCGSSSSDSSSDDGGGGGGGDGGTAPTISSLKDAADTTIAATGTTTANPNSFTLTFDTDMDETSVTTAGNITLACGTLTPTIATTKAADLKTYTITVTDAWGYALLSCTLTVTTNVKSSGGTAIASAATYTFTNPCAVSDEFNAQSISDESSSCWTVRTADILGAPTTLSTWALMSANVFSFNATNGTLDVDFTGHSDNNAIISKTVTVSDGGFQIGFHFKSVAGFLNTGSRNDAFYATLTDSFTDPTVVYNCGVMSVSDGTQHCFVEVYDVAGVYWSEYDAVCNTANTDYHIKLLVSSSGVTKEYKEGTNGTYQDMTLRTRGSGVDWPEWSGDWKISGDNKAFLIEADANTGSAPTAELNSIYLNGLTVSGQY